MSSPENQSGVDADRPFRLTGLHAVLSAIFDGKLTKAREIPGYLSYPTYFQ